MTPLSEQQLHECQQRAQSLLDRFEYVAIVILPGARVGDIIDDSGGTTIDARGTTSLRLGCPVKIIAPATFDEYFAQAVFLGYKGSGIELQTMLSRYGPHEFWKVIAE